MKWRPPRITPRGIRTAIPTGYVLGRIDRGTGAVQLIPLQQLATGLSATGVISGGGGGGGGAAVIETEGNAPILTEGGDFLQRG